MSSENPLVSVIVAVYNGQQFLKEALDSVLSQPYRPLELIVVDDGSTDRTAEIAKSFAEVQYIYQTNQGPAAARNNAIAIAKGDYFAFIDADDLWTEDKLTFQMDQLLQNSDISFTVGRIKNFFDPGLTKEWMLNKETLLRGDFVGLITIVAHRKVFAEVGNFNVEYRVGSDFEWFTRAKDAGMKMKILKDNLLHRRIHDSNLCIYDKQTVGKNLATMFKRSIDLQRKKNKQAQS